jgi:hypothetical protein
MSREREVTALGGGARAWRLRQHGGGDPSIVDEHQEACEK